MWKRLAIASLIGNAALISGAIYVASTHRTKIARGELRVPMLQFDGLLSAETRDSKYRANLDLCEGWR